MIIFLTFAILFSKIIKKYLMYHVFNHSFFAIVSIFLQFYWCTNRRFQWVAHQKRWILLLYSASHNTSLWTFNKANWLSQNPRQPEIRSRKLMIMLKVLQYKRREQTICCSPWKLNDFEKTTAYSAKNCEVVFSFVF